MTILSALKTYLLGAPLKADAPLWADYLGAAPTQYSIVSLPGTKIVQTYLDGGSEREFPFALQSAISTADELERLENSGVFEAISDWFETQTKAGILPTLATGKTATAIETLGCSFLYEQGVSSTGIMQVTCKLSYSQQP